jgi:hypothetical protein
MPDTTVKVVVFEDPRLCRSGVGRGRVGAAAGDRFGGVGRCQLPVDRWDAGLRGAGAGQGQHVTARRLLLGPEEGLLAAKVDFVDDSSGGAIEPGV